MYIKMRWLISDVVAYHLRRVAHPRPPASRPNMSHFQSVSRQFTAYHPLSAKMPGEAIVLRYAKLSEKAYEPVKGSEYAAGFDLRSAYNYTLKAHGKELVMTDLQIEVPKGCYGRIAPRSGLSWKNFIDIGAGVIDMDYRGNVGVVMFNHGDNDFVIKEGDRIAQLICEKIEYPALQEVQSLDSTVRGSGGFGSTGVH